MKVTVTFPDNSGHKKIKDEVVKEATAALSWIGDSNALLANTVTFDILTNVEEAKKAFQLRGCGVLSI